MSSRVTATVSIITTFIINCRRRALALRKLEHEGLEAGLSIT